MNHQSSKAKDIHRHSSLQIILSVSLVVSVFGLLYLRNLEGWLINDDEGSFLYQVWRISDGEQPYQDFFTTRWPLFLYTGAGWMRVFGATVIPMRVLSVCMTLGTGILVFLIARQTLPAEVALLSMVVFLIYPDVFRFGRSFQPEPFYIFFSTLGLYLVARGQAQKNTGYFLGAGAIFAIASLYKLLSILVLMGCVLFLAMTWLQNRASRRRTALFTLSLLVPYIILFGLVAAYYMLNVPRFYDCVIGVNLAQGQESSLSDVLIKGVAFLVQCLIASPVAFLVLPAAWDGWRRQQTTALPGWQLPTALAFLILSRDLFPRLLLYLAPSLSILLAASLEPIRLLRHRSLLFIAVVSSIIIPWTVSDALLLLRNEHATMDVVQYVQSLVPPDGRILSDYQEINFYAHRPATYLGAEISHVVVSGGKITGADLISEITEANVKMVIIDVSPITGNHLMDLQDYAVFIDFLERQFVLADTLPRGDYQLLEIYVKS